MPTSMKIMSEQALPTDAMAERSTRFEITRTIPAVMSISELWPSLDSRPKNGGNWRTSASMEVRPPDAYSVALFWRSFLRALVERGLGGVQLVVSDAHAGLKKAIGQVLGCPWQRCSVHFLREALGHARREQQPMLAALLRPIFNADTSELARELVGDALERLRKPLPKVAALLEEAEEELLAFYAFHADHWPKLRSTNPLERVNREIGRRTHVVGIFPNDRSLIRLAASVVIEQNDEWLVGRRYLSAHSLGVLGEKSIGKNSAA